MSDQNVGEDNNNKPQPQQKDIWDKLHNIGGFAAALVAGLIAIMGSMFLHNLQDSASKLHLYTQILSEQQRAENEVRKDMFVSILESFMTGGPRAVSGRKEFECAIDKVDRELLQLEMISRNFHENIDLYPLFIYVLRNMLRDIEHQYANFSDSGDLSDDSDISNDGAKDHIQNCQKQFYRRFLKEHELSVADLNSAELTDEQLKRAEEYKKKRRDSRMDLLRRIARRITSKQLEALNGAHVRMRFTVDLSRTCQDMRPTEPIGEREPESCGGNSGDSIAHKDENRTGGGENRTLRLVNGKDRTERTFRVYADSSYPDWSQVRVRVDVDKTDEEIAADPDGEVSHSSELWLSHFEFPLVDNQSLSKNERYAPILDSIDERKAEVSLIYFPASYSGFKENSYYHQRIVSSLLTDEPKSELARPRHSRHMPVLN